MRIFGRRSEVVPSPNIWYHADVYERENQVQDVDDEIWTHLADVAPWSGGDVVDVGCGTGFHLPRFAATARSVVGVEPHPPLVRRARERVEGLPSVTVLRGTAQRLPLPESSVDVVHARTAYFFGPGCEPGLREVDRVLRPGGALVIVDLDTGVAPYGDWMLADLPRYRAAEVDAFFAEEGFTCRRITTRWSFPDRRVLEAVLRIEFSPMVASRAVVDTLRLNRQGARSLELPVGYRVLLRRKPVGLLRASEPLTGHGTLAEP
ncbi:methyltransferase domain-containing protein [Saccharomonospora azurea]|uniref:class I SAM-dependent methyltransferase n=1 Tax=Saccharomonospora azurea TaxID=40988 RepID=UPI002409354B|nr:class I SAM-dependent methyltransferase [Saccharomonospora azurea]